MNRLTSYIKANWFMCALACVFALSALFASPALAIGAAGTGALAMAGVQFGGGRLGAIAVPTAGMVPQSLQALPPGAIDSLYIHVKVTGKSDGAAFASSVGTGSSASGEGVDDTDKLLDAIFNQIAFEWSPSNQCFNLKPSELRTVLGLLNQRDFIGGLSGNIPISSGSASSWTYRIVVPVSLAHYIDDGVIFANGAEALRGGSFKYDFKSNTPTVTLANGNIVVSAVAVELNAETGGGTEFDIGNTWRAMKPASLPTIYEFPEMMRLALLDTAATTAATSYNVGTYTGWTPEAFKTKYQADRLAAGGYDITARCVPLIWCEHDRRFLDFVANLNGRTHVDAIGATTLTVYDIVALPPNPTIVQQVSTVAGGGGAVAVENPAPASLPPGYKVPGTLADILPKRIRPAALASGPAEIAPNPVSAGNAQLGKVVASNTARKGILSRFKW